MSHIAIHRAIEGAEGLRKMTTQERLREMASQILTPSSKGKHFFNQAADELDSLQKQLDEAVNHANKYERDYMEAVAKLAEAKALLRKFEWSEVIPSGYAYCPVCHFTKIGEVHQADCALAAMVKEDGK